MRIELKWLKESEGLSSMMMMMMMMIIIII
jgi:hypothetical protein